MVKSFYRWFPFLLAALAFAVYARALPAPYLWDDVSLIEQNPAYDDHANLPLYFVEDLGHFNRDPRNMGFYRPLMALTFHVEVALFGRHAPGQRAINVLWHVLAAIAVWLLAQTLLRTRSGAAWAAALFAVHPLASEQVLLIANRCGLMAGALSLWTLVLFTRIIPPEGEPHYDRLPGAMTLYLLALLSKPNALVLIAPALAWLWLARPQQRRSIAAWLTVALPLAALAIFFVALHWGILQISHAHKAVNVDLPTRILAVPALTLDALRLALLPLGLRAVRSADYAAWTSPPAVGGAIAIWLLLLLVVWRLRKQTSAPLFGVVWFATTIAPAAGLVALVRPVAEHYYDLSAVGAMLALAGLGELLPARKTVAVLAPAMLVFFTALTVDRAGDWRSEEALWRDNLNYEPNSSEVLNNLGSVYAERNRGEEALELFDRAAQANPGNTKARLNRAHQAIALGKYAGVLDDLTAVLQGDPCHTKALTHLGRLTILADDPAAAELAERLQHDLACAVFIDLGRGMAARETGRAAEAHAYYERFLAAIPDHPLAAAVRREMRDLPVEH
ncbi:MAG TPA: glycosyltransferase family 39 protein [bacterium]|nr:glycosyltransferase family 39 protein [bacterium]